MHPHARALMLEKTEKNLQRRDTEIVSNDAVVPCEFSVVLATQVCHDEAPFCGRATYWRQQKAEYEIKSDTSIGVGFLCEFTAIRVRLFVPGCCVSALHADFPGSTLLDWATKRPLPSELPREQRPSTRQTC